MSHCIQLHMGTLFGIYNQVALALLALGLLAVSVMGLWKQSEMKIRPEASEKK